MRINRFLHAVVFAMLGAGCESIRDARLTDHRQTLAATCKDPSKPMEVRMAAFDELLYTFKPGTRQATLYQFVDPWYKTRISGYERDGVWIPGNAFTQYVLAPGGSDRHIGMNGDRVR